MWPFREVEAQAVRSEQPYWLIRNGISDATDRLGGSVDCDIVVVGAGITGALVADALRSLRRDVVVIDQRDKALGSTSASTALLQYEVDKHLVDLAELIGWEKAQRAYAAGVESIRMIDDLARELPAGVSFKRLESLYLASVHRDVDGLKNEFAARRRAGLEVEWLEKRALLDRFGCHRPAAIVSAAGGQLDPFRMARSLLDRCASEGARVFARTTLDRFATNDQWVSVHTTAGPIIRARHVVVCCGYESLKFLPSDVATLHSTYALATDPLIERGHAVERALIWESARPYVYARETPDHRLIIGGEDIPFKNAAARDAALPRKVEKLKKKYRSLFRADLPPVAYSWAGTFGETVDGLPYIGRAAGVDPRIYFALCFGGNGITYSAHAGPMIKAAIEGVSHPLNDVFGFERAH